MKTCTCCGRHISAKEWQKLPLVGHMCMAADETGPEEHHEYRNCPCLSTLTVDVGPNHAGTCSLRMLRGPLSRPGRGRRDPKDPAHAKTAARALFKTLSRLQPNDPSFMEHALVLADAISEAGNEALGEDLALALSGKKSRLDSVLAREANYGLNPPYTPFTRLRPADAVKEAKRRMFPPREPRKKPCMPNRTALRELIVGADSRVDFVGSRLVFRELMKAIENTCAVADQYDGQAPWTSMNDTMTIAAAALRGYGVEDSHFYPEPDNRSSEAPLVEFLYVNMRDIYRPTLFAVYNHEDLSFRFRLSTEDAVMGSVERRYGAGRWGSGGW